MQRKIAFGTTIYREGLGFAKEYFTSLRGQTNKNFDLILLNDNLNSGEISRIREMYSNDLTIINSTGRLSISALRVFLIQEIKKLGYEWLILGDFDDVFCDKRIERIIEGLEDKYTFTYHNIITFEGCEIFKQLPLYTTAYTDILESNFLGLSNTAVNLKKIDMEFLEELHAAPTSIFDWYLFSKILLNKGIGKCIHGTYTKYRIHENNLAGLTEDSKLSQEKEIEVKVNHYNYLKEEKYDYKILHEKYKKKIELQLNRNRKGYWWELYTVKRS